MSKKVKYGLLYKVEMNFKKVVEEAVLAAVSLPGFVFHKTRNPAYALLTGAALISGSDVALTCRKWPTQEYNLGKTKIVNHNAVPNSKPEPSPLEIAMIAPILFGTNLGPIAVMLPNRLKPTTTIMIKVTEGGDTVNCIYSLKGYLRPNQIPSTIPNDAQFAQGRFLLDDVNPETKARYRTICQRVLDDELRDASRHVSSN